MKKDREWIKQETKKLDSKVDSMINKSYESICTTVVHYVNNAEKMSKSSWNQGKNIIINKMYKLLENVFAATKSHMKNTYGDIQELKDTDISDLTYQEDKKTLEQRISEYWNEAYNKAKSKTQKDTAKSYLFYAFDRLTYSEAKYMQSKIKNKCRPLSAGMIIIDTGECDCCTGGEFGINDDVDLPPYHPFCNCTYYFDEIDDMSEIEEVGEEDEARKEQQREDI